MSNAPPVAAKWTAFRPMCCVLTVARGDQDDGPSSQGAYTLDEREYKEGA